MVSGLVMAVAKDLKNIEQSAEQSGVITCKHGMYENTIHIGREEEKVKGRRNQGQGSLYCNMCHPSVPYATNISSSTHTFRQKTLTPNIY